MTQSKSFLKTQLLSRTVDTSNNSTILFLKNLETSTPQTTPQKNSNKNLFRKNHHPPKKSPQHTHTHILKTFFPLAPCFYWQTLEGSKNPPNHSWPFHSLNLWTRPTESINGDTVGLQKAVQKHHPLCFPPASWKWWWCFDVLCVCFMFVFFPTQFFLVMLM